MSFEKEYYESPDFWAGNMLEDESNTIRFHETIGLLPKDCTSLLDVGCGNGKFVNKVLDVRPELNVLATDRSEEALQYVKCEKFISDINSILRPDQSVDAVSCLQVLEHILDNEYNQSISELARVAKRYILISVPYKENLKNSFSECPKCQSSFSYELHMRSYQFSDIENQFRHLGFKLKDYKNIICREVLIGQNVINSIRNIIYPQPKSENFKSPVCVVCGYKSLSNMKSKEPAQSLQIRSTPTLIRNLKTILKKWWPKQQLDGYWIIALYERS